jgi:alanyl-tRNA synthetase
MTVAQVRQKFLQFFKEKGHAIIPSASLIPENDPTVLFTTAGMHPLVPYLMGEKHPMGTRIADAQKCLRTDDIEEVGDNRHLTFFEMLGNWSLGDYFKQEAIGWSFEFLTDEKWLKIDPKRLCVTVFEGDADAPRDDESIAIWQSQFEVKGVAAEIGVAEKDEPAVGARGPRVYAYPKKKNWWGPAGMTGPCGPDTEIFYDTGREHDPAFGELCHPNCDCGRFVEIWNNVFMEYRKTDSGAFEPLAQKNVDTGMGLERMAAMLQNVPTVFDTEVFSVIFDSLREFSGKSYGTDPVTDRSMRIIFVPQHS